MKNNQYKQMFPEFTAEFETSAFTELDDEFAATCSGGKAYTGGPDPDVILFDGQSFTGNSLKVNATSGTGLSNLAIPYPNQGIAFNNKTSSISIIRGQWQFYEDAGYNTPILRVLGPGRYSNVDPYNNTISSLKRIR